MNWGGMVARLAGVVSAVVGGDNSDPFEPSNAHLFDAAAAGGPTLAGVSVSSPRAMRFAAFWGGVTLLADTFARPPLILYRDAGGAGDTGTPDKQRDTRSPLGQLLYARPNRWQTPFLWKQTCLLHRLLGGNTVCELVSDPGTGTVQEIVPLRPDRVHIHDDGDDATPPVFRTWDASGRPRDLLRTEVLYVPNVNVTGKRGTSVLAAARDALGVGIAAADHSARTFGRGLLQRVLLSHPRTLTPKGRAMWDEELDKQAGPDGAGRWLILPEGMAVHGISINPQEAQLLEARQFSVLEICRFLRLPPQLLGETSAGMSYASVEQFFDFFISTTMDAHYRPFEEEVAFSLLTDAGHSVEFLRQALLRSDVKTRWMSYGIGLTHGVYTRNDVRRLENLPPREGLDEPLRRLDMTTTAERQARAAGWQQWPGAAADRARQRTVARAWEADRRRMRLLAETAARRLLRAETRFIESHGRLWESEASATERHAAAQEFYARWGRRLASDLALPEDTARWVAQERGTQLLAAATEGLDTRRFSAGLAHRLVRLALYDDPDAAAAAI